MTSFNSRESGSPGKVVLGAPAGKVEMVLSSVVGDDDYCTGKLVTDSPSFGVCQDQDGFHKRQKAANPGKDG